MKKIFFLLITTFTVNCYSQIIFEKGYYVDNSGQKIECLIKNVDWRNNPTSFEYKKSEKSETKITNIQNVKEFGVYNVSKFIRKTVRIDRSTLSKERNPIFKEEQLFLQVLNEGKANLYRYAGSGLSKYFYNKENTEIEQLVYKKYETSDGKLGMYNYYKQQLLKALKCDAITLNKIESLTYKRNSLMNLFTLYNNCSNSDFINYENNKTKDLFNLTFRPRLNKSSLSLSKPLFSSNDLDLGDKIGVGFGIETEFLLSFNKNKWAFITEVTYQSFKSIETINVNNVSGGILITDVNYSSIEIPIGLRHYFFINADSKVFMNISYILDLVLNSSVEFRRIDNSILDSFEVQPRNNLALGLGYKHNDRYSMELRYQTNRDILSNNDLDSGYKMVSFIIGYSIF